MSDWGRFTNPSQFSTIEADDDRPKIASKVWDDEDEVPESWDVDEKPKITKPKEPAPPKMTAKDKIAAKTEKKNKIVADLHKRQEEKESKELTELEREELCKEQEFNLIMDSFGVSEPPQPSTPEIEFSKVSTKQDFIDLLSVLTEKFKKLERISSVKYLFKVTPFDCCSFLVDLENLKELSTSLSALVVEKQKLAKTKTKKKATKTKLIVERSVNDYDYNDEDVDDYDDFL